MGRVGHGRISRITDPANIPTKRPDPDGLGPRASTPQTGGLVPRVWFLLGPISVLIVLGLIGGLFVNVPYVAYAPGTAQSADPLVKVPPGKGYENSGTLLFLTVSVRSREPAVQALVDWLDPDVDVRPYNEVYPQQHSRKQDLTENTAAMTDSKESAQQVAFEKLGLPVKVTGTGVIITQVGGGLPVTGKVSAGDVITEVDGQPAGTTTQLTRLIRRYQPGDDVTLAVQVNGRGVALPRTVKLSRNPQTGKPMIGVGVANRGIRYDFPFKVSISSGDVIGPSGGLVFTLAIIDRLTPGSLTGGHHVAVTGEIASDGTVQPIGGVVQKLVAAERAGADTMIVPSEDYADAAGRHSRKVHVYRADTVDQALAVLKSLGGDTSSAQHPLPAP